MKAKDQLSVVIESVEGKLVVIVVKSVNPCPVCRSNHFFIPVRVHSDGMISYFYCGEIKPIVDLGKGCHDRRGIFECDAVIDFCLHCGTGLTIGK